MCADHAQSAGRFGTARADIRRTRHIVKVDPLTVLTRDNALCAQHLPVGVGVIQRGERCRDLLCGKGFRRFGAPAREDLVRVVVMVMVVIVVVAAAGAVRTVIVVMHMLIMVMIVMMRMLIVVMVMMAMLIMIMVVVFMPVMVVVVMMMRRFLQQFRELVRKRVFLRHR